MTKITPGKIPSKFLALVPGSSPKVHAEKNTVAAFVKLKKTYPEAHVTGRAAAYWSAKFDKLVHKDPAKYAVIDKGLSPVGFSKHLTGTRINIHGITIAEAAKFGFSAYNSYTFDYNGKKSWE